MLGISIFFQLEWEIFKARTRWISWSFETKKPSVKFNIQRVSGRCETFELRSEFCGICSTQRKPLFPLCLDILTYLLLFRHYMRVWERPQNVHTLTWKQVIEILERREFFFCFFCPPQDMRLRIEFSQSWNYKKCVGCRMNNTKIYSWRDSIVWFLSLSHIGAIFALINYKKKNKKLGRTLFIKGRKVWWAKTFPL